LRELRVPSPPVILICNSDEEMGSPSSTALIEGIAREARAVLVLEPSLDGKLKTARTSRCSGAWRSVSAIASTRPETTITSPRSRRRPQRLELDIGQCLLIALESAGALVQPFSQARGGPQGARIVRLDDRTITPAR
jgi:hypothetical protein